MSKAGLSGLQLATADIVTVARSLTADEWKIPSAAQGWSVQDVVSHAGNLLTVVMDAVNGQLVTPDGMGIEALNDQQVAEHRGWDPLATVDFLESQLAKAVQAFTPLQDEPYASMEAELLDLGRYQLHAVVDMFTFDFTTHLRFDILAPRGPIERQLDPLGEALLGPALSWLLGGIPKMQGDLWRHLEGPVGLILTGPATTSVVLSPIDEAIVITPMDGASTPQLADVTSSTSDFLAWSTTRLAWRDSVKIEGDDTVAADF
ncbi:MAG: hypothetical protein QOE83_565, partial [Actinomycetota bacterium]|nr:hypothetical protein [Actinomycetota bacterium]